ncbi:unnamed protein product [Malassezia sympodialis ATCC 42132]|uniref:Similar to S.cerevisiae protein ZRT1 (High-affinity zinc transporter of the plasma membrane) n=1 Tax=Malassezia sympodialis (strain ATCC 42132) TaxID=1230383 RepID=M5ER54_MALS4|nr:uncharacterized protein MSY001_2990 [Malassezia sympodialis ATCC 42132]CCV00285.1 unnamed protein product [Malassezia sympodialis ATCC 42132]SHO78912.1 Similar to S.cerevisiae protein ZRT1 (High-affinity zinc transporter of the plasma membrane) [Malassezia sympodialis ATCC 42132]|eukprot:XP_018741490.1 uncharacterized protein MSY001_2990 [Malassezia sympodialis ATCC 42132]
MADDEDVCVGAVNDVDNMGVRIGAIFVILVTTSLFTLFPIVTKRIPRLTIPQFIYDFAKYFGSGVIIATAFIHLLEPAADELSQPCLGDAFQNYPMAYGFALISMMLLFIVEFFAYRLGTLYLKKHGIDTHGHHHAAGHGDASMPQETIAADVTYSEDEVIRDDIKLQNDVEANKPDSGFSKDASVASEVVGVMVLELGVVFHSVIIGLTLATSEYHGEDDEFVVLYPVIVFHQLFEGLGLGSRLAFLPAQMGTLWPCLLAMGYSICTPIGMAIGLGVRHTYTTDTPTGYYVTGVFDAVSAGILIYTGLVELLAHDFVFNQKMHKAPMWKVAISIFEVCLGAGIMALLGRWA